MLGIALFNTVQASAMAESVVLSCFSEGKTLAAESFSVRLDEDSGRVYHAGPYRTVKVQAIFTPKQVVYQFYGSKVFGSQPLQKYIINRHGLQLTRFITVKAAGAETGTTQTATGACVKAKSVGSLKSD